jgi:magnesium-protoporphyrin O-methyltransferase
VPCSHCADAGHLFDHRVARAERWWFRIRGHPAPTRILLEALEAEGVAGASVLDVGAGVGLLHRALLEAGAGRALDVDASAAYQAVAREEARREGMESRVDFLLGDLVDLAPEVTVHDLATLDRVLCCYPFPRLLLATVATRTRRLVGLVYPRENVLVRAGVALLNLGQRLRGSTFRVRVHDGEEVRDEMARRGFQRILHRRTLAWQVEVFRRRQSAGAS